MNKTTNHSSEIIMMKRIIFFSFSFMIILSACHNTHSKTSVQELKCSNMENPEGIDAPLLSWKIKSSQLGLYQTAWEIEIASSKDLLEKGEADIWKSGKKLSEKQFGIQPESNFAEGDTYFWRVRI